jgi:hypothetical protein
MHAMSRVASLYRRGIRIAYGDAISIADLATDGADLLGMGIAPGPKVGEILRLLLERVLEDPSLNTRAQLLAVARELAGVPPPYLR